MPIQCMTRCSRRLLGFEIEDAPHLASKFFFKGTDMIDGSEVHTQHPIVKELAHEAYYIQVPRITPERYDDWGKCSRLLKLLSLFEQNYFVDKKYLKKYVYHIPEPKPETEKENETDKILKKMITKLGQIASDPYARRVMEEEEFMATYRAIKTIRLLNVHDFFRFPKPLSI